MRHKDLHKCLRWTFETYEHSSVNKQLILFCRQFFCHQWSFKPESWGKVNKTKQDKRYFMI